MNLEPENTFSEKTKLHPRNPHRFSYDFPALTKLSPGLSEFVSLNRYNNASVDFSKPAAVRALNKALFRFFYDIKDWEIPQGYLCPPVPGRADYIHYMADLLAGCNDGVIPAAAKALDIGIGANGAYPLIGSKAYGWRFVGSDIDPNALASVERIIASNKHLQGMIECRLQKDPSAIFKGIVKPEESFDFSMCNPPFHASAAEAREGTSRKLRNLGYKKPGQPVLNFGGQGAELWCPGGELAFIGKMVGESVTFSLNCFWFSTLVSKSAHLPGLHWTLKKAGAFDIKTIEMAQGNKISRILAWTFLNAEQQQEWKLKRWKEI